MGPCKAKNMKEIRLAWIVHFQNCMSNKNKKSLILKFCTIFTFVTKTKLLVSKELHKKVSDYKAFLLPLHFIVLVLKRRE